MLCVTYLRKFLFFDRECRNVSEDHLKEIFGCYGTVTDVTVEYQYHTIISKGIAHITMNSVDDAKKAIFGLNNGQIDGCSLLLLLMV